MLSNYNPAPVNINIDFNSPPLQNFNSITGQNSQNITKYVANYDFGGALNNLNAMSVYVFNSTKLFDFEYGYNSLASSIANLLSLSADKITPWTYGEIYNVLDAGYTKWTSSKSVMLYYYPLSINGSTTYLNFTYKTNPQFVDAYYQLNKNYPFPPSDDVITGSPSYKIISKYTILTYVYVSYTNHSYIVYNTSKTDGNKIIYYRYWANDIYVIAYLYANGSKIQTQYVTFTVDWHGGTYKYTIYGSVLVPPGVYKKVFGNYTLVFYPKSSNYTRSDGNRTIIYVNYYPDGPSIIPYSHIFNWYKYNASVSIEIDVYNGSNPTTYVGNQVFNKRTIYTSIWYTVWSSSPQSYTVRIITSDHIKFMNYDLTRTWDAGNISFNPTSYISTDGITYNYYLRFSTSFQIKNHPPYIFKPIPPLNKSVVLQWSYFINNYSIANGLFNVANRNIDQFNFILPQFITATFKDNLVEHTIILASFFEPWNVSRVTLNISNTFINSSLIFIPIYIIANTTYSMLCYALGTPSSAPNVTMISYEWYNTTLDHSYFPTLQSPFYNGTIPPAFYTPFTNKIWLNYGIYWPYKLPYSQFGIKKVMKVYSYWYNPGWPGWFPIKMT
jgi:hypothetical protein